MDFRSILFNSTRDNITSSKDDGASVYADLNLDQIIDAIVASKEEYDLKPFFLQPLGTAEQIRFRHQVMKDLEDPALFGSVNTFAAKMRIVDANLRQAEKLYYPRQKQRWFLDSVAVYCSAVQNFTEALAALRPMSAGLTAFRGYLQQYVASEKFLTLALKERKLRSALNEVRYTVHIHGSQITVRRLEAEPDYSNEVELTFDRFRESAVKDYSAKFPEFPDMNHIEAQILDFVAQLYPEMFLSLESYYGDNQEFLDPTLVRFDCEVQFYIAYLDHITALGRSGLVFCYPTIADRKDIFATDAFDLALANKLVAEHRPIVTNSFHLEGCERILAVSGPNQGGKTTFARMFGQLHYLAALGCQVPAREASLFLPDRIFTHFERQESTNNLRGKLQDDLIRIYEILEAATARSILIMNEIFTSTTLRDAIFLSRKVLDRIVEQDLLCVWVTFVDEVASYGGAVVSMVSGTDPRDVSTRTFKIVRRKADGIAQAMAIAEKFRLTYSQLKERLSL